MPDAAPNLIECPCGCRRKFRPVIIGSHRKKYATNTCKARIQTAALRWVTAAVEAGLLSYDMLRPFMPGSAATPSHATPDDSVE